MKERYSEVEYAQRDLEKTADKLVSTKNQFNSLPWFVRGPLRRIAKNQRERRVSELSERLNRKALKFSIEVELDKIGTTFSELKEVMGEPGNWRS